VDESRWQLQVVAHQAQSLGVATQLYWNRVQAWGAIQALSELKRSTREKTLLSLELALTSAAQAPAVAVNVWGSYAQFISENASLGQVWVGDGYLKQTGKKGEEALHIEALTSVLGSSPE
jgi:hypothetical protein